MALGAVLAFAVVVTFVGGFLFKTFAGDNFSEGTFRAYSLLNNVPGADANWRPNPSYTRHCRKGSPAPRARNFAEPFLHTAL